MAWWRVAWCTPGALDILLSCRRLDTWDERWWHLVESSIGLCAGAVNWAGLPSSSID